LAASTSALARVKIPFEQKKKTEAPAGLPADLLFLGGQKKRRGKKFLLNKKPVRLSVLD
jgi:hypothetical protein